MNRECAARHVPGCVRSLPGTGWGRHGGLDDGGLTVAETGTYP
jgi:hypothetical protein